MRATWLYDKAEQITTNRLTIQQEATARRTHSCGDTRTRLGPSLLWLWASCGRTKKLSSSQPTDSPYRRTLSRVCSNAWFCLPELVSEKTLPVRAGHIFGTPILQHRLLLTQEATDSFQRRPALLLRRSRDNPTPCISATPIEADPCPR
jgi:hypothetical protein